jgi:hypothetical protein
MTHTTGALATPSKSSGQQSSAEGNETPKNEEQWLHRLIIFHLFYRFYRWLVMFFS